MVSRYWMYYEKSKRLWNMYQTLFTLFFLIYFPNIPQVFSQENEGKKPRVVYPERTKLDFEGLSIQGELKNPGEFYFQKKEEEKFDFLVKRRMNFHKEMLRDVIYGK